MKQYFIFFLLIAAFLAVSACKKRLKSRLIHGCIQDTVANVAMRNTPFVFVRIENRGVVIKDKEISHASCFFTDSDGSFQIITKGRDGEKIFIAPEGTSRIKGALWRARIKGNQTDAGIIRMSGK